MKPIEILSLYLPYKLQGIKYGKIYFLSEVWADRKNSHSAWRNDGLRVAIDCMPLLNPLSMIIEEIEHQGERFVPLEKLTNIHGGRPIQFDGKCFYTTINESGGKRHDEIPMHFSQLQCYQKMFNWHIDLFNLIPEGKAIDKSKL